MSATLRRDRDAGSVLPLVLVVSVVLSLVVVSLATYASANLNHGHIVEERADRLAAADGGIRYAVEQLRLQQSTCTTDLGNGSGTSANFPSSGPLVNGAAVAVTCQRIADSTAGTGGWSLIVTGGTSGNGELTTQGGGEKRIGGRVFAHRASTIDGDITIENGDLWYGTTGSCSPVPSGVTYYPPTGLRGPICTTQHWTSMFSAPAPNVPTASAPDPTQSDPDGPGGLKPCVVLYPGKYTNADATKLTFNGSFEYYFRAGEYYFENVDLFVGDTVAIAGYADGSLGDVQSFTSQSCEYVQDVDKTDGGLGGVTFYMGGTSQILINKGELEIMRRLQGDRAVSIHALDTAGSGYIASTLTTSSSDYVVKVNTAGQADLAMHGQVWAPRAYAELQIVGQASGAALGGIVIGAVHLQSSGSGLMIRVETSPLTSRLMLTSTATIDGGSTSVRAIAQIEPDTGQLVLNSWRVCEHAGCDG